MVSCYFKKNSILQVNTKILIHTYSEKGSSLAHNIQSIASHDQIRSMVLLDLQHINKFYPQWTHIMIQLLPTNKPVSFFLSIIFSIHYYIKFIIDNIKN